MLKRLLAASFLACALAGTTRADFLAVEFGGSVYRISETTGIGTLLTSSATTSMNSGARSASGVFFSENAFSLVTINPATGATTAGPALSRTANGVRGMAFQPGTGVLFAAQGVDTGTTRELVTINTATGLVTVIGQTAGGLQALEFASNGTLYGWEPSGITGTNRGLVTINPLTGAVTDVNAGANGNVRMQGLGFHSNGTLYGATQTELYTINLATGVPTLVGSGIHTDVRSLDFIPTAVPEPGSFALAGLAALGIGLMVRRRRAAGPAA